MSLPQRRTGSGDHDQAQPPRKSTRVSADDDGVAIARGQAKFAKLARLDELSQAPTFSSMLMPTADDFLAAENIAPATIARHAPLTFIRPLYGARNPLILPSDERIRAMVESALISGDGPVSEAAIDEAIAYMCRFSAAPESAERQQRDEYDAWFEARLAENFGFALRIRFEARMNEISRVRAAAVYMTPPEASSAAVDEAWGYIERAAITGDTISIRLLAAVSVRARHFEGATDLLRIAGLEFGCREAAGAYAAYRFASASVSDLGAGFLRMVTDIAKPAALAGGEQAAQVLALVHGRSPNAHFSRVGGPLAVLLEQPLIPSRETRREFCALACNTHATIAARLTGPFCFRMAPPSETEQLATSPRPRLLANILKSGAVEYTRAYSLIGSTASREWFPCAAPVHGGGAAAAAAAAAADGVEAMAVDIFSHFARAGAAGLVDAMYSTGILCKLGVGTSRNPAAALEWMRAAAIGGHASACLYLGRHSTHELHRVQWLQIALMLNQAEAAGDFAMLLPRSDYLLSKRNIHGLKVYAVARGDRRACFADVIVPRYSVDRLF
jgi:TPR repeat protein